jgi:hypothetical protein
LIPNRFHQFIAADDPILVDQKVRQQFGHLGFQTRGVFAIKQVARIGVEAPMTE